MSLGYADRAISSKGIPVAVSRRTTAVAALAAALTLTFAGCSGATDEQNADAACEAYNALTTAVSDARGSINADSTLDEISAARDSVKAAYDDLDDALDDVYEDRTEALEQAWEGFNDDVENVDGDSTVPEAVDSLSGSVQKVQDAAAALGEELTC